MLLGLPYLFQKLSLFLFYFKQVNIESQTKHNKKMAASTPSKFSSILHNKTQQTNFPNSPAKKILQPSTNFSFSLRFKKSLTVNSSSTTKYNEIVADEEIEKIKRLQNGSDVRGVALEGEKGRTVDLTPPVVEAIAESFGEWVISGLQKERGHPVENVRVSMGRDPRISGSKLSVAVFAGLARSGCIVFDMGLATTPACFMSTLLPPFAYDASIMVR